MSGSFAPRAALVLALICAAVPAGGQPAPIPENPRPEDLRALSDLLERPGLRAWLEREGTRAADIPPAAPEPMRGRHLDAARDVLRDLAAGVPRLPGEVAGMRGRLMAEAGDRGLPAAAGLILAFAGLGFAAQAVFRHLSGDLRRRMEALPVATVEERLAATGWRALYGIGLVAAFAAGSLGVFLVFAWPPLLQEVLLAYLLVFLTVRLTRVGGDVVLAPDAERFRLLPMGTEAARYWCAWSAAVVGAFAFDKASFDLVPVLGGSPTARSLVGLLAGLIALVLALAALWNRPGPDGGPRAARGRRDAAGWLVSVYLVGLWLTALAGAAAAFFVGVTAFVLVLGHHGLRRIVGHLLRPAAEGAPEAGARPLAVVALQGALRIALVVGGALVIARILGIDLTTLTARGTPVERVARGALDLAIVVLGADFVWQVARGWIDQRLSEADAPAGATEAELRRRQRLRTLLPMLRNLLLAGLMAVAGLMALATLGVEVGPLLAGAGVVGIAVGFGAQTLVKDILSGMFFLLDDAFRVGEYIESGRIKGTVEAFSLRSIKLRHHRGALHTVPFGALSTITNYSRDWVIDKLSIGVPYETDLARVKRIVKEVGRTLAADPDFAPHILETLKMQGVEAFGDYAIQVRLKMMTRPGEQFVIRRRAYALIKEAFAAEGIPFAVPTVSVSGGNGAPSAAAHAVVASRARAAEAAAETDTP